jgi:hypothetical protein
MKLLVAAALAGILASACTAEPITHEVWVSCIIDTEAEKDFDLAAWLKGFGKQVLVSDDGSFAGNYVFNGDTTFTDSDYRQGEEIDVGNSYQSPSGYYEYNVLINTDWEPLSEKGFPRVTSASKGRFLTDYLNKYEFRVLVRLNKDGSVDIPPLGLGSNFKEVD